MSLTRCIKCYKKLSDCTVKCLNCNREYCSRRCQIKNLKRHRHYCNKTPKQIVSNLVNKLESELMYYCYLGRQTTPIKYGHVLITSLENIAAEETKTMSIDFGKITDDTINTLIPASSDEYTIYIHTNDYRGYFRYPMDNIHKLNGLTADDMPEKMMINMINWTIFCKNKNVE